MLSRLKPFHIIILLIAFFGTAYFLAGLSDAEADVKAMQNVSEADASGSREYYFQNVLMQEKVILFMVVGGIILLFLMFYWRRKMLRRSSRSFLKYKEQIEERIKPEGEPELSFRRKLLKAHPELTANDLELVSLMMQNSTSKEIARELNITPGSVNTARYRLRKKLGLQKGEDLLKFLLNYS